MPSVDDMPGCTFCIMVQIHWSLLQLLQALTEIISFTNPLAQGNTSAKCGALRTKGLLQLSVVN